MRKLFSKKLLSVLLASSMVIGSASALTGCGSKKNEVIKLNVYSQLANFSGKQIGWSADILKKKFNVELNISTASAASATATVLAGDNPYAGQVGEESPTRPRQTAIDLTDGDYTAPAWSFTTITIK